MKTNQIVKKSNLIFVIILALIIDYLLCFIGAAFTFEKSGITVLPTDKAFTIFFRSLIVFANWGTIIYVAFIIFYFAIYFSYLPRMDRISIGKIPIWLSLLIAILFFQLTETLIPIMHERHKDNIYRYQYGLFFFNKGYENYYLAKKADKEAKEYFCQEGFENFERYLSYDPVCSLDKNHAQFITAKKADEKQPVINDKREMENELILIKQEKNRMKTSKAMSPPLKFRTIDEGNSLLESGQKEDNLYKCVKAYEVFDKAYIEDDSDIEFKIGRQLAQEEVFKRAFRRKDVEALFEKPLETNIYMRNFIRNSNGDVEEEIFSAKKMLLNLGNYFFQDIKIERLDLATNNELYSIVAPYGMLKENVLIFSSLGNEIEVSSINMAQKISGTKKEVISSIPFYGNAELLPYLGDRIIDYTQMSVFSIIKLIKMYQDGDPREQILWEELLYRVLTFSFMLFFPLLFILLSSKLKPNNKKTPWFMFFLFPIVVLAIYIFYSILHYITHVMIAALFLQRGCVFTTMAVSAFSLSLILIIICSYVVALKRGTI